MWTRKQFIQTGLMGLSAMGIGPWMLKTNELTRFPYEPNQYNLDQYFPRYKDFAPMVPVWNVTPDIDRCIHRFHLSSPFSPSGRYLGLTRLLREDRAPKPGEIAEIVLVDLFSGNQTIIAQTKGWDSQLGAQVQWGLTDEELYFNDVNTSTWTPYAIKLNPLTGEKKILDGAVYDVSPNGKWLVSTDLKNIGYTQAGYGVIVPKDQITFNQGASETDGVFVTNTQTGQTRMIASYKKIVDECSPTIDIHRYGPGDFYGFHTMWNSQSNRIMLVLRFVPHNGDRAKPMLITMNEHGEDIHLAIPTSEWADKGGNHPNWHPDGNDLIMNLNIDGTGERFVKARYDGSTLVKMTEVPANRGHISVHPNGKLLLNDAYPHKDYAFFDTTAPIWLVDMERHWKHTLIRFESVTKYFEKNPSEARDMRVDPHPVWDTKTYTHIAFNAVENGTRRVFVADLSKFVTNS